MVDPESKYSGGFANNFDLVRLVLATSVVFLHFDHLLNDTGVSNVLYYLQGLSSRAVPAFFVVSGFVVYMSFDRGRDLVQYTASRFLRLYPAYFIVVAAMACLPLLSTDCVGSVLWTSTWWRYVAVNLAFANFLQPTLPCVFEGNFDHALNGSLWTLKIEVMFYAAVPLLYLLIRRFGALPILIGVFVLSHIYVEWLLSLYRSTADSAYMTLANQLPGQMSYFSVGILLYLYHGQFHRHWRWLVPVAAAVMFLQCRLLEPLAVGILAIAAATLTRKNFDLTKIGDLSYGVYIFHFPIIQLSLQLDLFEGEPFLHLIAVLFLTFVVALLSSRFIEIPAMRLKKKVTGRAQLA